MDVHAPTPSPSKAATPAVSDLVQSGNKKSGKRAFVPAKPRQPSPEEMDALRVQAAAVAAQQSALSEEEARLVQRQGALEQQEEQLASHLEEKRRKIQALNQKAQAERNALLSDRVAYEKYIDKVTGDLSQAQLELVENQQRLQAERKRLTKLVKRLKARFKEQWKKERDNLTLREETVANETCNQAKEREALERRENALAEQHMDFNADYEVGRRQLRDGWARLRRAQRKWRLRRGAERAALALRAREVENAELALAQQQRQRDHEQAVWEKRRDHLEKELEGLDHRVKNQRLKIVEQQEELQRLATPRRDSADAASRDTTPAPAHEQQPAPAFPTLAKSPGDVSAGRLRELDRLAAELAEQRLLLTEQWERLARTQQRWQDEQVRTAAELETLIQQIQQQDQAVLDREQAHAGAEAALKQKHQELTQLHQQLVGWRARLRSREQAWEGERNRFLADLRHREELADTNINGLVEVRQRWAQRRRQELARLRGERANCERLRKELAVLREECLQYRSVLEEDKKTLTEKNLALEQFRNEMFARSGDSANAERRIERLRRRWLSQHAAAVRTLAQDRDTLQTELTALDARYKELEKQASEVLTAEANLAEKVTAFEHKQALANAKNARMQTELQNAEAQRSLADHELAKVRDEVERIARALLNEPDAPPPQAVDKAA
jgi:chromosome segregation ATPase